MHGKWFAAGVLATAGLLAFALPVRAGDTHRLSIPRGAVETPTLNLVGDGKGADNVDVHRGGSRDFDRGFHGSRNFDRGFHGSRNFDRGFHGSRNFDRGFHGSRDFDRGFGGFRGYYGGYRGYYGGYGYSRGYYGGYGGYGYGGYGGYSPSYYGSYYQPYYYSTPSVYYYSAPSYSIDPYLCPSGGASARVLSLSITVAPTTRRRIVEIVAAPTSVQPDDQTFPYDGGPRTPAPMPKAEPMPDAQPSAAPVDGHSVSLPAKVASKLVYPAYGEQTTLQGTPRLQERGILVKGDPARKPAK
jgi:hypothetical protein